MSLFAYMQQTQRLVNDIRQMMIDPADLTSYINTARGQIAGDGECIRIQGTLNLASVTRVYAFTSISTGTASITGVQGVINVRQALNLLAGGGYQWLTPRPFEWFTLYNLAIATPNTGLPNTWSQFGQGVSGSIYFDPVPTTVTTVTLDCVCYPIPLALDTDVEAVPYLWTDAIPYFSAYLALMSIQSQDAKQGAAQMFERYTEFVRRARQFATPSVLSTMYSQTSDPTQMAKLGVAPARGGGG